MEIMPSTPPPLPIKSNDFEAHSETAKESGFAGLSQDEFEKLQNYKKLLDNGLILQGEYDAYKRDSKFYVIQFV
jgi:hypothetical protein